MHLHVYYAKPEVASRLRRDPGLEVNPATLAETHAKVGDYHADDDGSLQAGCETVFEVFQAEVWSPNGEARDLIKRKGLAHTSMSVGDVVVYGRRVYQVAEVGFAFAGYLPEGFVVELT